MYPCKKLKKTLLNFCLPSLACVNAYALFNQHAEGPAAWCLGLTLIPSKRDRALSGLKALSVLSDLIGPRSEKPNALAIRLTIDTYTDRERWRGKDRGKGTKDPQN